MKPTKYEVLIEYCDKCGKENNYPLEKLKSNGVCELCRRIGPVNKNRQQCLVNFQDFNEHTWEAGNFTVDQMISFPVGQKRETIHPTLTSKILTEKCTLYFDKDLVIIANPKTGQQIRIRF